MKPGLVLTALVLSLSLGACSQAATTSECSVSYGSCEAVVDLDARLMRAPFCVRIEVAPEDPCSCEGAVTVANDCPYDVAAKNFDFQGSETVIRPGESATFEIVPGEAPGVATTGEEQYQLVGNGSDFEVIVDYGVTEKSDESGCSTTGAGHGSRSAGAWLGLGALAMYVARRRRRA